MDAVTVTLLGALIGMAVAIALILMRVNQHIP